MSSVLFVFLTWSGWALRYENRAPLSACVAALFLLAFMVEGLLIWLKVEAAYALGVLTTLLYWCTGIVLRYRVRSGKQRYPKLSL